MLRVRVIPALLLDNESLVKTERFGRPRYIGDPCNTVRIFNELEVDELCFLDITATRQRRLPNLSLLRDIATECFMPLSYGGGITRFDDAAQIYGIGFEKVVINSHALARPEIVSEIATVYGSQAVVASIDVRRSWLGRERVYSQGGRQRHDVDPVNWAREMERRGAGEILLTAIDREGTWSGFDIELIGRVASAVTIPVIAHGGAGSLADIVAAVHEAGASAVALGAMVVYQKRGMGVLVNFPTSEELASMALSPGPVMAASRPAPAGGAALRA